jgi:hypothetical protein
MRLSPPPGLDPSEATGEQERLDPSALASCRMAALAATLYPGC